MTAAQENAPPAPLRLAVLASGGGRTLTNLREHIAAGKLRAEVALVICSNAASCETIHKAHPDLSVQLIDRKVHKSTFGPSDGGDGFSDVVFAAVRKARAELVVLAGFLSLLTIPDDFAQRIINIHPALLPAFGGKGMYGHHVHAAVLATGCKLSGCTVHFADPTYDTGPIILQRACPVFDDDAPDTLAARVFEQECLAYPEAIQLIADGNVHIAGRVTHIDGSSLVVKARKRCVEAHGTQTREGNRPYWEHPFAVVALLEQQGVNDPHILAAAYLHDTVEDTAVTLDDLERDFGRRVAKLVEELTNPDRPGRNFEQKHVELAEHARIMTPDAKLIKLADRTHNLRQLHQRPVRKRGRYARATVGLLEAISPWPKQADELVDEIRQFIEVYA